MQVKTKYLIALMLIAAAIAVGLFKKADKSTEAYAEEVLAKCQKEAYRPTCYEKEIPALVGKISMEEAFTVTKIVQEKDPSFAYCHVLAHKISFEESRQNPGNWKEVLSRCPISMCNYGCLHGSLIQRFRGETLSDVQIEEALPDLKDVCEPRGSFNPTEIDRTMCYHALGHLAMYITGADVPKANRICKEVGVKEDGRDYYETCVEGVYMTIYQGVDPEDISLVANIKPGKDKVRDYCSRYSGVDYEACNRESYPLFREELKKPLDIVRFCSYTTTEAGSWKCYATAIGDWTVRILEREEYDQIAEFCLGFPGELKSRCFANTAVRIVQIEPGKVERAASVCREAAEHGIAEECWRDMAAFSQFAFHQTSEEKKSFCSYFPQDWRQECDQ